MQHPISLTHSVARKFSSALLLSEENSEIFKEKIKYFKLHCHHYYYYDYCLMAKSPDAINQWSQWCGTNFNSVEILGWICSAVLGLEQQRALSMSEHFTAIMTHSTPAIRNCSTAGRAFFSERSRSGQLLKGSRAPWPSVGLHTTQQLTIRWAPAWGVTGRALGQRGRFLQSTGTLKTFKYSTSCPYPVVLQANFIHAISHNDINSTRYLSVLPVHITF